jgi:hypothetical protein
MRDLNVSDPTYDRLRGEKAEHGRLSSSRNFEKRPSHASDPVILISSIDSLLYHAKSLVNGAVDYATDSLDGQKVLWRIETHISLRRLQETLESAACKDGQPVRRTRTWRGRFGRYTSWDPDNWPQACGRESASSRKRAEKG